MKREEFRQNIRQRQLNKIFHQIRKNKFAKSYKFTDLLPQQTSIMIQYIDTNVQEMASMKKNDRLNKIIPKISQFLITVNKQRALFSFAFNEYLKNIGDKIIDFFKKDVPESIFGDLSDEQVDINQQHQISVENNYVQELEVACKTLELAKMIQFQKFDLNSAILATKILWNVFSNSYHLPHKSYPQTHLKSTNIMINLCICLKSLLQNPDNHPTLKKHMKQMGLPQKICQIIDVYDNLNIDYYISILNLITMFTRKIALQVDPKNQQDIGDICVIGIDSGYYEKFCAFCLYFLKKGDYQTLLASLSALEQIFNEAAYLIDSCQFSSIKDIMNLINIEDRYISSKALQVFNTIIFYSQSTTDDLIQKTQVISIIHIRLKKQQKMPSHDPFIYDSIQRCTNILCDMLLSRNKKVKQKIYENQIWQYLYECIQENHPLLATIIVFNYFFSGFGRRKTMKILPSYIGAISNLNLNNTCDPLILNVRKAIQDLYAHGLQFWQQDDFNMLSQLLQSYGLMGLIQQEIG